MKSLSSSICGLYGELGIVASASDEKWRACNNYLSYGTS